MNNPIKKWVFIQRIVYVLFILGFIGFLNGDRLPINHSQFGTALASYYSILLLFIIIARLKINSLKKQYPSEYQEAESDKFNAGILKVVTTIIVLFFVFAAFIYIAMLSG
jgi:hypothetical protein